jgi:hypothetical protein
MTDPAILDFAKEFASKAVASFLPAGHGMAR